MGAPVTALAARRRRNIALAAAVALSMLAVWWLGARSLGDARVVTGWTLVALITVLGLFSVRKAVPTLPLWSAAAWLQAHIYLGLLAGLAFVLHTDLRWPNGVLDTVLWLTVVLVWLSGAIGLALTRVLPRRAAAAGPRVIFERIPARRADLAREVEQMVMEASHELMSSTLIDYYLSELHAFFSGPRNLLAHLTGIGGRLPHLERQLDALDRYTDATGRDTLARIRARVREKDALDRHYALEGALKLWLFVHIPLSWAMLPLVAVHIVLAYAFGAGP